MTDSIDKMRETKNGDRSSKRKKKNYTKKETQLPSKRPCLTFGRLRKSRWGSPITSKSLYPSLTTLQGIMKLTKAECENDPFLQQYYELQPVLARLNDFVGIKRAKKQVVELINFYMVHQRFSSHQRLHSVIEGDPGTGKTTFASILAELYCSLGILKKKKVHKVAAKDLIGEYIGQTNQRTQRAIDEAMGGVLLIDEVYSLGAGESRDKNGYGIQAINTLNQALTEHGNEFIVIIAGYKKEIEKYFFEFNQGLRRRFSLTFTMERFDEQSSKEFLLLKLKELKYHIDDSILEKLNLKTHSRKSFTGGDLEIILHQAEIKMIHRLYATSSCCDSKLITKMTIDDLNLGVAAWEKSQHHNELEEMKSMSALYS